MDLSLFAQVVDPIVKALSAKDPAHALDFKENGTRLKVEMMTLDAACRAKMLELPEERRRLVTSHDAFSYFVRRYMASSEGEWESRSAAPEGLAPDGQMGLLDIKQVSEFLCKYKVATIFSESNVNTSSLRKLAEVCKERGHNVSIARVPLYGDTMGEKTYLEMIAHNIDTLHAELQ